MLIDRFSGVHSTDCAEAIRCFEDAVRCVAQHRPGAAEALDAALGHDPGLVAAHVLKGFAVLMLARIEFEPAARRSLAAAQAARSALAAPTRSEQALVGALEQACAGRRLAAADLLEARLADEPGDFLALKLAHGLRFMAGDHAGMLAASGRALPTWTDDRPGAGFVFGCHAFSLEEAGLYAGAEAIGLRAVAIEPADAWGLHAVSHVHEMQNRTREGVAWLGASRASWRRCNNFSFHLAWHLALFHLEAGETEETLRIYDEDVRPSPTDDYRDMANATSLLWRLEQFGVDVGGRWAELCAIAKARAHGTSLVFASLHHLLAALSAGDRQTAAALLATLEAKAAVPSEQGHVAATVGVGLARVLMGLDARQNRTDLARLAQDLPRMGGSCAQRDVFMRSLALIAADRGDDIAFERVMSIRGANRRADRLSALAEERLETRRMKRETQLWVA
jgi:hypothetical protein